MLSLSTAFKRKVHDKQSKVHFLCTRRVGENTPIVRADAVDEPVGCQVSSIQTATNAYTALAVVYPIAVVYRILPCHTEKNPRIGKTLAWGLPRNLAWFR